MILAAVLCVAIAIVVFATMGPVADAARAAYTAPPPKPDQIAAGVQVFFTIVAVVFLLVAVGEVVLGLLDLRGSNVARIISWVFNGLVVLCFGCFGALSLGRGNPTVTTGSRAAGRGPADHYPAAGRAGRGRAAGTAAAGRARAAQTAGRGTTAGIESGRPGPGRSPSRGGPGRRGPPQPAEVAREHGLDHRGDRRHRGGVRPRAGRRGP